jgi:zinc/manganese transport system substrate-binding protein
MKNQLIVRLLATLLLCGLFALTSYPFACRQVASSDEKILHIIAAENFWGSLITQLGGTHVQVLSIVTDPNADPHEYESNTANARAVSDADYAIVNGAGYDSWMDKLLSAGGNPNRKVLKVADLLGKKAGDNPHFWYNPAYVNQVVSQMAQDLMTIDPVSASYYQQQYQTLTVALAEYQNRIADIEKQFGGTKVAATEDIAVYLTDAAGLNLISPPAFMQAVAEGNDPPAQSIAEFQDQLEKKEPAVLIYNPQTVTPLTESIKKLATDSGIPIVGISETIQPSDGVFQDWMNAELITLQNTLNGKASGK